MISINKIIIFYLRIELLIQMISCLTETDLPEKFADCLLELDQTLYNHHVDELGHIIELDTIMPHYRIESLPTQFDISSRKCNDKKIIFAKHNICFNLNCFGPFQFNLDLLSKSCFNPKLRTIILIAGFLSKETESWITNSRDLWLKIEDVNVIVVSWHDSNKYIYSTAVAHTPLIARQTTILLYYLAKLNNIRFLDESFTKNIHIIGHSLGAHIAGFIGQDFSGKIGRITGLDPAGPSFDQYTRNRRLDSSDAMLVDVIHTNRGKLKYLNAFASAPLFILDSVVSKVPLINRLSAVGENYTGEGDTAWYGIDELVGHIDYYANDGKVQPGCSGLLHICDHNRAYEIYVEILKYEASLIEFYGTRKVDSRLLAFKSIMYEHFLNGINIDISCPKLLNHHYHLDETIYDEIDSCSIPLDLISPPDELKEALIKKHNFDFDPPNAIYNNMYFFATTQNSNLVGDHFVLKLYLSEKPNWDETRCSLEASLVMEDETSFKIHLSKLVISETPTKYTSHLISSPFTAKRGVLSRLTVAKILSEKNLQDALIKNWPLIFPKEVGIKITDAKSKTVTDVFKDKVIKFIKFGQKDSDCQISVGTVEIHPLIKTKKNFSALYGIVENEKLEIFSKDTFEYTKFGRYTSRLILNQYVLTNRIISALII